MAIDACIVMRALLIVLWARVAWLVLAAALRGISLALSHRLECYLGC